MPIQDLFSMCTATGYRLAIPLLALVALSSGCTSDRESARASGFYAEIAVEVEPGPGDPLARFGSRGGRIVIRWWYAPEPARWRWEFETTGTGIDDGMLLTVADGNDSWEYDDRTNFYRRGILADLPGVAVSPLFSAPVGPAHAASVDALMAQWRERGYAPEVALAREATLLGRRTQIVELRTASAGVARAFVDPERMFIMRWAVDATDGGQSFHADVTALDYGTEIDADRFTFEPPRGAREREARPAVSCGGGVYVGDASFPAEPGFLSPAYTPAGYRSVGAGSELAPSGGCDPVAVWVLLEAADGAQILLRQRLRPGGMAPLDRSWEAIASNLDDAHSRRSGDGVLSLLWRAGGIVALLQADAASIEELLRTAESARLMPARSR